MLLEPRKKKSKWVLRVQRRALRNEKRTPAVGEEIEPLLSEEG